MRITMVKASARVPDLVANMFGHLPAGERDVRVAEFKAANPHLGRRTNLPPGTVLLVPDDVPPEAAPLAEARDLGQASMATLVQATAFAVHTWSEQLKGAIATEEQDLKGSAAALKSREFREDAQLSEVLGGAAEAIKVRSEELGQANAFLLSVVPRISADLKKMQERLG